MSMSDLFLAMAPWLTPAAAAWLAKPRSQRDWSDRKRGRRRMRKAQRQARRLARAYQAR